MTNKLTAARLVGMTDAELNAEIDAAFSNASAAQSVNLPKEAARYWRRANRLMAAREVRRNPVAFLRAARLLP